MKVRGVYVQTGLMKIAPSIDVACVEWGGSYLAGSRRFKAMK